MLKTNVYDMNGKQTGTMGTMGGGTYTEEDNTIIPL